MATLLQLRNEIKQEIGDSANNLLTDEINTAINAAIEFWERKRFDFNEGADTSITTVNGTPDYAIPSAVYSVDEIQLDINSHDCHLLRENYRWWIKRQKDNQSQVGQPNHFAIYRRRIWLYPTPNDAYDMTIHGIVELTPNPLSLDADTNAWITEGKQLIKMHAKADLCLNLLQDPTAAQGFAAAQQFFATGLQRDLGQDRLVGYTRPEQQF
jgi:hypothetical protein